MKSRLSHGRRNTIKWQPPRVIEVREGSPCEGLVEVGDVLLEIDSRRPQDILDCLQASEPARISLRLKRNGREISSRVHKQSGEPLGLVFDEALFDGMQVCRNKCLFCFVDQMPPGLRPTLYIKDDDYRLSFYYGNFITMNNLSRKDLARIIQLRLAPLYVSLHSTNPDLRSRMMGGDASGGLTALKALLDEEIEVHLQVVSCPGINDGDELHRTLQDVLEYYATAASLAVVPVGITSRAANELVQPHDERSSLEVLETVEEYQQEALRRRGDRMFFASDEFYLNVGRDFADAEDYNGFPQIENGVGMARKFIDEAVEYLNQARPKEKKGRGIITGVAGEKVIRNALAGTSIEEIEIVTVANNLFGPSVTVTSLLSGRDVITALRDARAKSKELLIPETLMRDGRFLDDSTPQDVLRETGITLIPIEVNGAELLTALYDCERLN